MTEYIDLTTTWEEILPTWLRLVDAVRFGECDKPEEIMENFRKEMLSMARAADKWNAQVKESKNALLP